jgi:hypothetical protein
MNAFLKGVASIGEGMSRIFDFHGNLTNSYRTSYPYQSDADAIRSDWKAVGNDMRSAMRASGIDINAFEGDSKPLLPDLKQALSKLSPEELRALQQKLDEQKYR